jgi:hypothetical protein
MSKKKRGKVRREPTLEDLTSWISIQNPPWWKRRRKRSTWGRLN